MLQLVKGLHSPQKGSTSHEKNALNQDQEGNTDFLAMLSANLETKNLNEKKGSGNLVDILRPNTTKAGISKNKMNPFEDIENESFNNNLILKKENSDSLNIEKPILSSKEKSIDENHSEKSVIDQKELKNTSLKLQDNVLKFKARQAHSNYSNQNEVVNNYNSVFQKPLDLKDEQEGIEVGAFDESIDHFMMNNSMSEESKPSTFNIEKISQVSDLGDSSVNLNEKILNYIKGNYPLQQDSLDVSFISDELGKVDLNLSRSDENGINVMVNSSSEEAMSFFNEHKGNIIEILSKSGVHVSDFSVQATETKEDALFSQNDESTNTGDNPNKRQGQKNEDESSNKRKDLWDDMLERRSA